MRQHILVMILRVAPVHSCHAAIDLLCIGINARTFNPSDDALVAVLHKGGGFGLLVEAQIKERLFRLAAERLVFLGRVNLGLTYLVLLLRCGQNREGVPVCYPNDFSTERCSLCS